MHSKIIGKIIDGANITLLSGDIILAVSVDKDTDCYDGKISTNGQDVDGFDYLTLAQVVCAQCFSNAVENGLAPDAVRETMTMMIQDLQENKP